MAVTSACLQFTSCTFRSLLDHYQEMSVQQKEKLQRQMSCLNINYAFTKVKYEDVKMYSKELNIGINFVTADT